MIAVYLIQSKNRFYIGYTTNLIKRLKQHNSVISGGAIRTQGRGPWSYKIVVSGFRNIKEAMSFEWRFQYDTKFCRSFESRKRALYTLMNRERWTKNSPLSTEVELQIEYNPIQYGLAPENYNEEPIYRRLKKYKKRLYGTY